MTREQEFKRILNILQNKGATPFAAEDLANEIYGLKERLRDINRLLDTPVNSNEELLKNFDAIQAKARID